MILRAFDLVVSVTALVLTLPFLVIAAIAIKLTSPGPVLYLAERVGKGGKPFRMYKLRSMHVNTGGSEITATNDSRVFAVGRVIRKLKLDELPQFLNVIQGDMAVVGPRPEAPGIVAAHYTGWMRETLNVLPGVTSPGAIFYYAYSDALLAGDDPEKAYVDRLLGPKLALELAYMQRMNLWSNVVVVLHTVVTIVARILGKAVGPLERDFAVSVKWARENAHIRDDLTRLARR
jgi:lipopolysaccharide/colanic/teichoic acid biosynthesis glycosyltransferase